MARHRLQTARASAYRVVFIQIAMVTLAAAVVFYTNNVKAAYSLWLGGALSVVPQSIFIWRVFAKTGVLQAKQVVAGFYTGQALKIVITVVGFYGVYHYADVGLTAVVAGYVGAYLIYSIAPFVIKRD